ncbi:pentapeptide repeat-containing protein [Erythrobacter litoralis]|nr:pentapeptide repeat-containing protein [Erythrobacter litoralis]
MFETLLAVVASATSVQTDDDLAARAISACGFAEFDVTPIDAGSASDFEDFATQVEAALGEKIMIVGGDLSGADMRRLSGSLPGSCFYQTKLSGTDWSGTDLIGTKFVGTDLSGARFEGTNLTDARLVGVDAGGANFADAKLGNARWVGQNFGSKLAGASFVGAYLNYFTFDCGITMDMQCGGSSGVDFSGANLSNADLASYPIWGLDTFTGADFNRAFISPRAVKYLDDVEVRRSITLGHRSDEAGDRRAQVRLTTAEFTELKASIETQTDEPSFDCAKASIKAEVLICAEYQSGLRHMDRDLSSLYRHAVKRGATSQREQRAWLRQRNRCDSAECVAQAYQARMDALFGAVGVELVLTPNAALEFEEDLLPVADTMRSSALYQKMVPVIRSFSMQSVTLTAMEDGRILARGEAVGGNAHTCSLHGDALVYDPDTGWYAGELDDGALVPILRVWDNRLFFRYSGNMGDTPDEAADFITCGARAGFGEMRAVGK